MIQIRRVLVSSALGVTVLAVLCATALCCVTKMPGPSEPMSPPPESEPSLGALQSRLEAQVNEIAGKIGPRYLGRDNGGLELARDYIEAQFREMGYSPRRQEVPTDEGIAHNIEVEVIGQGAKSEIVVFGAHYDTEPGTPGADDNASGVAALLELARALRRVSLSRTLRFVAFANEEPPYFQTERMGSVVYARRCQARGENIVAMLSLEMLGYFSEQPGSQKYPDLIGWRFPDIGNFLAVVSDLGAVSFVRGVVGDLRSMGSLPVEGVALPSSVPGVWWSDHYGFRQAGYDAAMVTDTALFRNPHYHEQSDTPSTLDYRRLTLSTAALIEVAQRLTRAATP